MKIFNHFSKLFLIIFLLILISKVSLGQESENFVITLDDTRIELHGKIELDAASVFFRDSKGKHKTLKQKKIKVMLVHNRLFLNLKLYGSVDRLHEVIAFNSDYIMTGYWQTNLYVYIWDKDFNPIEKKISFAPGTKSTIKRNQERLTESISPYFASKCPDLMALFIRNIDARIEINRDISYYNCEGSLNPLEVFLKMKK